MSRRDRQRRRQRNRGHPIRRMAVLGVMLGLCAAAIGTLFVVGWVVAVADTAPKLQSLKPRTYNSLSEIFASNGTVLGYVHSDTLFDRVQPKQIPNELKEATVAIEDRRFWRHGALDYQGILRAGIKDLFGEGNGLQGASTLTMQLVNNMYMPKTISAVHNLKYKIIQARLAQQLEAKHSKTWILDTYLNDVPYGTLGGQSAIGIGAAAKMFFDKPVWKLDLSQVALLAGLPQAPSEYNPFIYPALAKTRRKQVLQAMVQSHYITQGQANAANGRTLQVQSDNDYSQVVQPYVFDYIEQQLVNKFGVNEVDNGGLKVYTTIDLQKQAEAQSAIDSHEGGPVLDNQPAAALVSMDPDNGHILAMANSTTFSQTQENFAADAERQTGSAFKVFALMTLIHDYDGDPNQTYYNSHFLQAGWLPQDPTWSVHTAEETYQGDINVTKATVVSDNTVFAQLAADLGWKKLDATAHAMGITAPLFGYPAEVLGGLKVGVSPLQMADAYGTLANGGEHITPTIISKVVFPNGTVENLGDPKPNRVFSDGETYAATKVLEGVVTQGTGTEANYGCPAAGKTGTAENLDNAWFVGYTPEFSTAVWVGYPQGNVPMADGFGGALAAPIWHDYMVAASNGYCGDFPQPTDPWHGQPFFGPRSTTGNPNVGANTGNSGNTGAGGGGGGGGGGGATTLAPAPTAPPQTVGATGGSGLSGGGHHTHH